MDDFYKMAVIATVLALAFATAAFLNSRRKSVVHTPPPTPPSNEPFFMKAKGNNASEATDNLTVRTSASTPEPVFKQMTSSGKPISRRTYADDEYVWE